MPPPLDDVRRICVVGGLRQATLAEQTLVARRPDPTVYPAIVAGIVSDTPEAVVMLGDQVAEAAAEGGWSFFEELMAPIVEREIPLVGVMGEYDYGEPPFDVREAAKASKSRYLVGVRELMVHSFGDVALVALDSNFDRMSDEQKATQLARYATELDRLDADATVKGVLVASHRAPYSDSRIGDDKEIQRLFVEPFLTHRKTMLYLSGHVRSYERFVDGNKIFVTSGGGGVPRTLVDLEADRARPRVAYRGKPLRPHHYLRLRLDDVGITGECVMLGRSGLKVGDSFDLRFPS